MKPVICFLTDAFISDPRATITGPMVQTYLLGKSLHRVGWKVHFIAFNKSQKKDDEVFEDLIIHWVPYRHYFYLFSFFLIRKLIRTIQPDFCYMRGRDPLAGWVAHFCRHHQKIFIWASSGETGVFRKKYRRSFSKKNFLRFCLLFPYAIILDYWTEYGIRYADRVIVQTETQRQNLLREFGLNGTIIQSGHPVPARKDRTLPWKILWIGSIKPIKQPEVFIELANHLQDLNAEFIMAGPMPDAEYGKQIQQMIQSQKNIRYLGTIPFSKSQEWIASCHILVNTTAKNYEGLPNAFVQAWLSGTVTMSLYTDPDDLITTHRLGKLSGTPVQLAEDIRHLIRNPSLFEELSRNARKYAIENFSIDRITSQLEALMLQTFKST